MWKVKVLKNRRARASTELALAGSAGTPDSGIQALDNSRGSSAAISELISSIGFALDQLDYDEEPGDFLRLQLERLAVEGLKYQNSRVTENLGEQWTCDAALSRLLFASCLCAARVYEAESVECFQGLDLRRVKYLNPSIDGTLKAAAFWTIERGSGFPSSGKELIISIRGSARKTDHIVNLNDVPRDTHSLFVLDNSVPVYAHAGFMNSAKSLLPEITKEISRQLSDDGSITHIIFTGHSAGGAVASLLFLHFVHQSHISLSTTLSLLTFGSAPVISQSVTKSAMKQPNVGLMLAIVNENDMVTRSDGPYIRSVVDLYRSRYMLPAGADDLVNEKNREHRKTGHGSLALQETWRLPAPAFYLVGDIIVLGEPAVIDGEPPSIPGKAVTTAKKSLLALNVTTETFGTFLFCDIEVHRRRAYLERLELIWRESIRESQNDIDMGRQWLDDVLSWSDTDGSLTEDFCSLLTASTFSSSIT